MPEDLQQQEPLGTRVSAILVVFNQAPALRRAIQALENSKGRERLEILVVDCASEDESSRMDEEFPAIQMLRLPHHIGSVRAMNIATRTAKGDLLFLLSPNVEVQVGTVQALADRLEAASELAAICPLLVDADGTPVSRSRKLPSRAALEASSPFSEADLALESIAVENPGIDATLVRKGFVRGMNYFDERYGHYWADAELAMQIRRAGKKILMLPGVRARIYPAPDPLEGDSLAEADRVSGAGAFVGKYEGAFAGVTYRLSAALSALARGDFGRFSAVLAGRKLDGSQAS